MAKFTGVAVFDLTFDVDGHVTGYALAPQLYTPDAGYWIEYSVKSDFSESAVGFADDIKDLIDDWKETYV